MSSSNTGPKRPVIRYYGGKWKLADWVISYFPKHKVYIEPFGGAASVLLKKEPARVEIYNDLSSEMVNLFRVLRDESLRNKLLELLAYTPYSREEWESCYPLTDDPIEQARRTIVLASMSHNPSKVLNRQANGFRTSSSGYHRMPQDFINLQSNLIEVANRIKEVIIECRPAAKVMTQHDEISTLHYVDPPYLGKTRSDNRNTYQHECFSVEDHFELSKTLKSLKGFVLLSGYPCEEYKEWYMDAGWHTVSKDAVTGAATPGKSKRTEVLYLNPAAAAMLRQQRLF
ncbi:MAG: DNA adenine methylase [Bacteroidota bacterium]